MSTVRITDTIRAHVREQIHQMFHKRLEDELKKLQHLGLGESCYEYYINAEERELIAKLNDTEERWLQSVTHINIQITLPPKHPSFQVKFSPPKPLPRRYSGYAAYFKLVVGMPKHDEVAEIFKAHQAMLEERDKLTETLVDGVLNKCVSLNQVLKVWPSALDFMPDEARQRHHAKTERTKNLVEEIALQDDLKASLLKARLLRHQS